MLHWWQVINKEAKSPAAIAHKRKYETAYESTPARKKYRRELERERRKRGVAGKGGKDMSHTKEGTIVPEDPHTNRARSHPSVGSTLKMVVVKAPLHDIATGEQVAGAPQPMTDFQARDPNRNRFQPDPFEFDFRFLTDHIKAPKQYQYESPDKSTRGVVNVKDNKARILGYATHRDERGEGKGQMALRNLVEELRQVHPNLQEVSGDGEAVKGFWQKMKDRGLIDVIKAPAPKQIPSCVRCGARAKLMTPMNDNDGNFHICLPCYMQMVSSAGQQLSAERQAQQAHDSRYDTMMYHGEPMDITMRLLKGFRSKYDGNCKVCGQFIPAGSEVDFHPQGGIKHHYDCGRVYVV